MFGFNRQEKHNPEYAARIYRLEIDKKELIDEIDEIEALKERKIVALEEKLERVYTVGVSGIMHVGSANYESRKREALEDFAKAMERDKQ